MAFMLGCAAAAVPSYASAEEHAGSPWSGYAGAGVMMFPRYTGGRASESIAVPLLMFEYKETVYVDLLRAGVRMWSSADRKLAVGVAAEPRFGFRGGDGARLAGMSRRRDSIEAGPSVEWETVVASFNFAWFGDVAGTSGGNSLRTSAYRQLVDSAQWDIGGYAGLERVSSKITNYYFGVRSGEATAGRASYQPGAATHLTMGLSATYKLSDRHGLLLGAQTTYLGGAAAASPIVETRHAVIGYLGLGWRL
jgi:outer membrane protein